jgi:membrane-associated protease RseP (regulator of RpoE activity)
VDVVFTPMARAAWLGLFVTALNLLPAGQFDGGHIVYALLGRKHGLISHLTFLALVAWGLWGTADRMTLAEGALSAGITVYALFLIVSGPHRRSAKRNLLIALVAGWLVLRLAGTDASYPDTAIWLVWSVLLYGFGLDHPPTRDLDRPLDLRRRIVGWFCLAVFVLTFIPRPVTVIG